MRLPFSNRNQQQQAQPQAMTDSRPSTLPSTGNSVVDGVASLFADEAGITTPENQGQQYMLMAQMVLEELLCRTFANPSFLTALIAICSSPDAPRHSPEAVAQQVQYLMAITSQGPSPQDLQDMFLGIAEELQMRNINPSFVLQQGGFGGGYGGGGPGFPGQQGYGSQYTQYGQPPIGGQQQSGATGGGAPIQ